MSRRQKINAEIMQCERELDALLGAMLQSKSVKRSSSKTKIVDNNSIRSRLNKVSRTCEKMKGLTGQPALSVFGTVMCQVIAQVPVVERGATALSDAECELFEGAARPLSAALDVLLAAYTANERLTATITRVKGILQAYLAIGRQTPTANLEGLFTNIGAAVLEGNYESVPNYKPYIMAIGAALNSNTEVAGISKR
jgi:hypothetical protein